MKLIEFIQSLSPEEQTRLQESLLPVVEARKAMLDYYRTTIPADLAALKKVEDQRAEAIKAEDKAELAKLDADLKAVREKISGIAKDGRVYSGHEYTKIERNKTFKKAKENFCLQY